MSHIFGLGLSHTATKSLNEALNILHIRSIHYPLDRTTYRELSSGQFNLSILKHYEAITDITTIPFYKQLDTQYPGSKFVLTIRDRDSWLKSMSRRNDEWKKYAGKNFLSKYLLRFSEDYRFYKLGAIRSTLFRIQHEYFIEYIRKAVYGGIVFDDVAYLGRIYDSHSADVTEYFKNRPNDLLVMDITAGDGWDKLCPFLGVPVPQKSFPTIPNTRFKPLRETSKSQ